MREMTAEELLTEVRELVEANTSLKLSSVVRDPAHTFRQVVDSSFTLELSTTNTGKGRQVKRLFVTDLLTLTFSLHLKQKNQGQTQLDAAVLEQTIKQLLLAQENLPKVNVIFRRADRRAGSEVLTTTLEFTVIRVSPL